MITGETYSRAIAQRIAAAVADATAVRAIPPSDRFNGMHVIKLDDYTDWVYEDLSATVAGAACLVPADAPAAGRWILVIASLPTLATPGVSGLMSGEMASSLHAPAADRTALKAIAAAARADGMFCLVLSDMSTWMFSAASAAAADSALEALVAVPAAGGGRWLRYDKKVVLRFLAGSGTGDAAVMHTTPAGARLRPRAAWWDVLVDWTGGAASAIGASSSVAGFNTKGDVLGGAAGDVAATLVATATRMTGTVGAKVDGTDRLILVAADALRFDRITSAFAAGSAWFNCTVDVLANAGA